MPKLSPKDFIRARQAARRLWRIAALASVQFLGLALFVLVLSYGSPYFTFLAWFVISSVILFKLTISYLVWKSYRGWRNLFEADLRDGATTQKTAMVYDRFRSWSVPTTYVLWADAAGEGLELHVEKDVYRHIQTGDTITVDYLPRSQLAIKVQNAN
jgi:hypothetical protein